MKGELRAFSLEGRPCACCVPQGEGPFPLLVLCGWGLEEKLLLFAQELPPVEPPYVLHRTYRYGQIKLTVYHREGEEQP